MNDEGSPTHGGPPRGLPSHKPEVSLIGRRDELVQDSSSYVGIAEGRAEVVGVLGEDTMFDAELIQPLSATPRIRFCPRQRVSCP